MTDIETKRLYFLDEMGAGLNLSPLYGRAPLNERVYDEKPTSRGKRVSMIGAFTSKGMKTALNFEGTLTGDLFLYFLEHFLCPLLGQGDYVIMDNASSHKVNEVVEIIEDTGAHVIYLPPYTPELNPIELVWNKIKTALRKLRARTTEQLYRAYAKALKTITDSDAKKFMEHAMKFLN